MAGRFRLFTFLSAALLVTSTAWASTVSAIGRFVAFFVETIAQPFRPLQTYNVIALDGRPLDYAAPSAHFLRHEAGVSRRSAARHT
jgi:hypothetical protein